jgi:beta-glucosidase
VRWLAGFAAVDADPGEEVMVEVAVPVRSLVHCDVRFHDWTVEPGIFEVSAGRSSRGLTLEARFEVADEPET